MKQRVREIWRKSLLTAMGLVVLTAAVMVLLAAIMSVLWASRTLRLLQEGKLKTAKT